MSNSMMSRPNRSKNTRANASRSGGRGNISTKGPGSQNAQSVSYDNFEGIYANPRLSHVIASITGLGVKVQVKNGNEYEGVFRTASSKAEFVLEMATKQNDEISNHEVAAVPTRENVIEKIILKAQDIVSLTAKDVNLDYATKDTFATDSMISGSKLNGQVNERDLQPWQADSQTEDLSLDSETSNGWDVNDMFRTNTQKFGVSSTFEENLSQYTTELEKKDTKEYKEREMEAARLAKEIESSPAHKNRLAKEVEDASEEDKYSAVHRPTNSGDTMSGGTMPGGPGGPYPSNKYIAPHLRNRQSVPHYPHGQQRRPPPPSHGQQQHRSHQQHMHREHHAPENVHTNVNGGVDRGDRKAQDSGRNTPTGVNPPSAYTAGRKLSDVVRGAPAEGKPPSQPPTSSISSSNPVPAPAPAPAPAPSVAAQPPPPAVVANVPVPAAQQQPQALAPVPPQPQQQTQPQPQPQSQSQPQQQPASAQQQPQPLPESSPVANTLEKKQNAKSRSEVEEELKKFSKDFNMCERKQEPESSGKAKETETENPKESKEVKPAETSVEPTASSSSSSTDVPKDSPAPKAPSTSKDKESPKVDEVTKKSKLNPEAKEFKFNPQAKPFAPQKGPVAKAPTPPRQQQPSPGLMAAQPGGGNLPHGHMAYAGQPVFAGMSQQYTVMASTPMQVNLPAAPTIVNTGMPQVQQKQGGFQKRPHTIIQRPPQHHPEMQAGHMMQVSAATGQPIMAPVGYTTQTQIMQYPTAQPPHHQGTIMGQMIPNPHMQYQHNIPYQKHQMYRMIAPAHQGQLAAPHHQGQHPYPQDIQTSAAQVYVSPGSGMPQVPQPHPQAQPQPHPTQPQPQPHLHHHSQQRHTPPQQPSQQQGQNPQHQQGQMTAGQQQQAQQHNSHPAPSPVQQVHHTAQPPPTQTAHMPHQPQTQILYQPAHQIPHAPHTLQHTPQSPQGIPPPSHSQAPPHQLQQLPVASHSANAHITTVTPVHPQPYPHTHPQIQPQVMMVPQQGHGHAHSPSAAGHTGAAGVVASNPPISAPYLQGPPHSQPPVHGTYPQNN